MVVFVGQIETSMRDREAFQEIDYRAMFGTVAKWVVEIDHPDRVAELTARAFSIAQSGRPGPVVVALPEDTLSGETEAEPRGKVLVIQASPSQDDISAVVELIKSAKKPVVLVGGGGWTDKGRVDLKTFVEQNDLPTIAVFRSQDLLDNLSHCYVGEAGFGIPPAVRSFIDESDLLLAVNVRFGETLTDGYTLLDPRYMNKKLIHIHASDTEIGKIFTPDLPIVSSPDAVMAALARTDVIAERPWTERTVEAHNTYVTSLDAPKQPGPVDMSEIMAYLRDELPEDTIITNGAGNFAIWPGRHFPFTGQRRLVGPQAGAMGAGVPASVVAKLLNPERTIICFAGDGDFQMNGLEIGTAMQYGAKPVILLLNNGMYGTIRMHQEREYPARVSGTNLHNPDFAMLAQSYGFHGERVEKTADFYPAFERALASKKGALIELIIDQEGVAPRATISSLRAAAG